MKWDADKFNVGLATLQENLSKIQQNISDAREILASQFYDLANLMLSVVRDDVFQGALLRDAVVSRFLEVTSVSDEKNERAISQNSGFVALGVESDAERGFIKLCETMLDLSPKYFERRFSTSDFIETDSEELPDYALGLVSYFKNIYADMAYESFSKYVNSPRASYQNDFSSVCEFVYNGECEYGILPFENSSDGLLTSFYSLITRYELKIVRQCSILQADGQSETKFVLLKKKLDFDDITDEGKCAEIVFSPDGDNGISGVLSAIECIGCEIIRVNAVRRIYDGNYNYGVAFICKEDQLDLLMLYLSVRNAQYNLLGFYSYS